MADLRHLPNLAALRAFEAAARHENFSRAAEEVHLTHGAISHQVRALERDLGVALFARYGKRLAITAEGERFAAAVRRGLEDMAAAADALRQGARQKRLVVTSLPSFAARWLAPRIARYIGAHPDIEVVLQSSNQLNDYARDGIDVGIRFGSGDWPGLHCELLMQDWYYPVASPAYRRGKLPRTAAELARQPLLRCHAEDWAPWFAAAGLVVPEPSGGLVFEDAALLCRAVLAGEGIALGRHSLVAQDVEEGALVRLSDIAIKARPAYYLVMLPGARRRPEVEAFRSWLLGELALLPPLPDGSPAAAGHVRQAG